MHSPTKGALIQFVPRAAEPRIWVFPLNPESLHQHWITPALDPAMRSPRHRLGLELVLDATDAFERDLPNAALQVPAQLAVLEWLAAAPRGSSLYFAWGELRLWPVRLLSLHVSENAFDAQLRVTRAAVALQFDVEEGAAVPGDRLRRQTAAHRDAIRAALAAFGLASSAADYGIAFGGA